MPSPDAPQRDRYGSTTDEDGDHLTLRARSHSGSYNTISSPSSMAASVSRRKSARAPSSLAKAMDVLDSSNLQSHDYSETEWWGMDHTHCDLDGVCGWHGLVSGHLELGMDVGETPYAPPELEDDPTLPIVGYYPALMVMTGVMAWVWSLLRGLA